MNERVTWRVPGVRNVLVVTTSEAAARRMRGALLSAGGVRALGNHVRFADAMAAIRRLEPDVVLLDMFSSPRASLGLLRRVAARGAPPRIVSLFAHLDAGSVAEAVRACSHGFLCVEAPSHVYEAVCDGRSACCPGAARVMAQAAIKGRTGRAATWTPLSRRESQVLETLAEGMINKEIAHRFGISVRTVETHRENIMRKLDIHNIAGLTRYAIAKGIAYIGGSVRRSST